MSQRRMISPPSFGSGQAEEGCRPRRPGDIRVRHGVVEKRADPARLALLEGFAQFEDVDDGNLPFGSHEPAIGDELGVSIPSDPGPMTQSLSLFRWPVG